MVNILDLKGERFNRLFVKEMYPDKAKGIKWICVCDCGNERIVDSWNLRSGNTQSCGCLHKENTHNARFIDLTSQRFGRLQIVSLKEIINGKPYWNCLCDCGNKKIIGSANLSSGNTNSCGCLSIEMTIERSKKYNNYDLSGNFGIGYTFQNEEFYFDLEDYELIKNYCWGIDYYGYVSARNEDKKLIKFHRLVMNANINDEDIDHVNRITIDNRKINLRFATDTQNSYNKTISIRNKSGVIGVSIHKITSKWRANINKQHLGLFDVFEDAVYARLIAEKEFQGDFAPQRHLFEEYGII